MEKVKVKKVVEEGVHLSNGVFVPCGEFYPLKTIEEAVNIAVTIINALNQEK